MALTEEMPAAPAAPVKHVMTLQEALQFAVCLIQDEDFDSAETLLLKILEYNPGQPDALHFLGVMRHAQGRSDEAIVLIRKAIDLMPAQSGPWNNLGNVYMELRRIDDAITAYERSVAISGNAPGGAEACNNLSTIHRRHGRWADAEAASRRAIELRQDFGDAWYNLSLALMGQGRIHEGLHANSKAIALWPQHLLARDQVIRALVLLGELDQAAKLYREWLEQDPDNPVVLHQLAACLGSDVPERASDAYVEEVFDSFATSFDAKLEQLHYRAPELVAAALQQAINPPHRALRIMDAGCGTGLCGPLLRPMARMLRGCDLSAGMLQKAASRGCYDELEKAELTACLERTPLAFDAIVSADTLVYFGALERFLDAAGKALVSGGLLVFTVEDAQGRAGERGYLLNPNGRYCHEQDYLAHASANSGLRVRSIETVELRMEAGLPVKGFVVVASKN